MTTSEPFIVRDMVRLSHLFAMVQAHEGKYGDGGPGGICELEWRADEPGWGLNIVCEGHYAFEEYGRDDVGALIEEATTYYAGRVRLWDTGGCSEHHPDPMPANLTGDRSQPAEPAQADAVGDYLTVQNKENP